MKLVASMIVRNEADRYLDLALTHLLTFCDEVRVIDDGSDDGTPELLDDVEGVVWKPNTASAWRSNEGLARQGLLEFTMEGEPDWVLAIDADEFVADPRMVRQIVDTGASTVYSLEMTEVWGLDEGAIIVREDGDWKPRPCPILWRAPERLRGQTWRIPARALACGREPLGVRRSKAMKSGSAVLHLGWARESEREPRAQRYFDLDGGRFHANAHLQSILWTPAQGLVMRARLWSAGLAPIKEQLIGRVNV